MKGMIALDIDGTVVSQHRPLSQRMVDFLASCHADGWTIFFATGRAVRWSFAHLESLPFPFFLACYNGACTFSFPSRACIRSVALSRAKLRKLSTFAETFGALIYEAEGQERVFYTAAKFSPSLLAHVHTRRDRQHEQWFAIQKLSELPDTRFAGMRFFLSPGAAEALSEAIAKHPTFLAPTMRDSFDEHLKVVQVTSREASKGQAMEALKATLAPIPLVIAAGDDMNDIDLLEKADVRIAMETAPQPLKAMAHHIASFSGEDPVYEVLRQAVSAV